METSGTSTMVRYCYFLVLIVLVISVLCSCTTTNEHSTEKVSSPSVFPTFVLTPGEDLEELWGGKHHDLDSLQIYVSSTITREEYRDIDNTIKERKTVGFQISYPYLGEYEAQSISIYKGQVLEFGEYRIRILDVRMNSSGTRPIVEIAILSP